LESTPGAERKGGEKKKKRGVLREEKWGECLAGLKDGANDKKCKRNRILADTGKGGQRVGSKRVGGGGQDCRVEKKGEERGETEGN